MLAIETIELTKKYKALTAVNRLNLKVKTNTVHGFLGPNGAGKTTTIKILIGLLKADSGTTRIFEQVVQGDKPDIRLRIGYMPELPKFPKHLTGYELLDIYGKMYGMTKQERREQIPKLLETVDLKNREKDHIGKYSKGMQQRLGIAQALVSNPELVIMDEPSLGLDPVGMVEVREILKEVAKEGVTVFISSHLLHEVQQICSHVTIINRGIALESDTLTNVSSRLSGLPTLLVEVSDLTDKIIKSLEKLSFVSSISKENNKMIISVNTRDDVRTRVSKAITKSKGVIVSMSLKEQSLEDVFMKLVKDQEGSKKK